MQAVAAELAGYAGKFRCLEITMPKWDLRARESRPESRRLNSATPELLDLLNT